jgi:Flp pilus assembly protein TadD
LREALRRDPADASAWFELGQLYLRLNRAEEAAAVGRVLEGLDQRLAVLLEKELTGSSNEKKEATK